jgi:hypothetical protein
MSQFGVSEGCPRRLPGLDNRRQDPWMGKRLPQLRAMEWVAKPTALTPRKWAWPGVVDSPSL